MKLRRNNTLRGIFVLATCLLSLGFAKAQSGGTNWELQSESKGVKLFYKLDTCNAMKVLLLKFENTNAESKHVNYNIIIESPGHNMPLLPHFIDIAGNSVKEGSCSGNTELTTDIKNISQPSLKVVLVVN